MPRVMKSRKICCIPKNKKFYPDTKTQEETILTLDEIEALRLADLEMLDQDHAAELMEISRATFQRILYSARKIAADALVNGKTIKIEGGSYRIADNHCNGKISCLNCRFVRPE